MQDDGQDGLEPEEELVLPEEDELDRRRQVMEKVELPERAGGSPLLRRVISGDVREQSSVGKAKRDRRKGQGLSREIGGAVQPGPPLVQPAEEMDGGHEVREQPEPVAGHGEEIVSGANPDSRGLAEVFSRTGDEVEGDVALPVEHRLRRRTQSDQEAQWEGRGRSSLWWLGAGVLCIVLVGASVWFVVRQGTPGSRERASGELTRTKGSSADGGDISFESLPIAYFVARSAELLPEVREVLMKSESGEGGAELLRGGEESLRRRTAWRKRYPRPAPFREEGLHEIHASGNKRFAYLMMTGERTDYSYLEAYFVKEGDRMLLDWEATEGYSEVLVDELEVLEDGEPRIMRAVINLSSFYTDVYPDEKYRCYTLHHDDPGEWLWAYTLRNSKVDIGLLSHMSMQEPLGRSRKVTVTIAKNVEGSRANQVEIEELLFGGWVAPPARDGQAAGPAVAPDG